MNTFYPYITYDNVLVWKALKDLAQLAPQYAHLEKTASEIKDAIMTHCVQRMQRESLISDGLLI